MREAKELLKKYRSGRCSDAELVLIDRWLLEIHAGEPSGLSDEEHLLLRAQAWRAIASRTGLDGVAAGAEAGDADRPLRRFALWRRWAAVAAVLVLLGLGTLYVLRQRPVEVGQLAYGTDIAPGGDRAFLTLGSGRRIAVDSSLSGQVALENGVKIVRDAGGALVYEISAGAGPAAMNSFETPRGGSSQLRLPDGTRVWLNAESRISYLSSFAGQARREVSLSGEGYFEVAKDSKHPFVVSSAGQKVEVLGTHFNVKAYGGGAPSVTTLLEGSVRILGGNGFGEQVLRPGQAAIVGDQGIAVEEADVEEAVGWKNGEFVFNNENLGEIMKSVARWYDVEVEYMDPSLKAKPFWGTVGRFEQVGEVLRVMELTGKVHFRVQGRKIVVMR